MATNNNGFNMLNQLAHYYSSYSYPFQYTTTQQELYPYVQPQQQQMYHSYLQQQQHSYLQQQQQAWEEERRRDGLKQEILQLLNIDEEELNREELKPEILDDVLNPVTTEVEEEKLRREQLERDIFDLLNDDTITEMAGRRLVSDRRLVSFLETDNSFLTPWNWNPDGPSDRVLSSAALIKIEPGSFFSDNLVFVSEDGESKYLSGTDAEIVSEDYSNKKTSDNSLDQTSDDSSGSPKN